MRTSGRTVVFLVAVFLLSACASSYPRLDIVAPLPANSSCRIALLPFVNKGEVPQGAAIFYKVFSSELNNLEGYDVVAEGDVLDLYRQFKLYRTQLPNEKQMQVIAGRLNAQLVIVGDILKMAEADSGRYVDTNMTVFVRIYDGVTGKILWDTYHRRSGEEYRNVMHYGRVNTITGLAHRMAREIKELWVEEGIGQCADR